MLHEGVVLHAPPCSRCHRSADPLGGPQPRGVVRVRARGLRSTSTAIALKTLSGGPQTLHQRGVVRVRRRGSPPRMGTCAAGGGGHCAMTFSRSSMFAAFSSSTCCSREAVYCCFRALDRAALSLFFTCAN